jgi:hypothetical protein
MPKAKPDPMTAKDLTDFVSRESDFAFEMCVLVQLQTLGFECSHSGTYVDPVTDKVRQYDIRAFRRRAASTLALAVECKNLRANFPLLLSTVPRTSSEAFHDLVVCQPKRLHQLRRVETATGERSAYKLGEPVGKKTDQVGRDFSSGELFSNDEATFEKLNQAVNSCKDLILQKPWPTSEAHSRAVARVLIVPTGLLWQVDYTEVGKLKTPPRFLARSCLFLDHPWQVDDYVNGCPFAYRMWS